MFNKQAKYIFLIIIVFIAACIETDIFLPALTDIMAYFSINENNIQGLLTWNFVGICIAGPLYGPISDSVGRKKPLLIALGLFFLGSIFTIMAQDFNLMLAGRVLQGLGSGGCFTLGTAIMFDVFNEKEAVLALTKINSIVPFIMAAAPMLGGYLNYVYGFRSNFTAIAVCVLASLLICIWFFDETLEKEKRSNLNVSKIISDFKMVLLSLPFWQTAFIVSLIFSAYLVFLSGISVLFVVELGVSKEFLPLYQAGLLLTWLIASMLTSRFLNKYGVEKVKKIGFILMVFSGAAMPVLAWFAPKSTILPTFAMMVYAFGANWVQGLYFPEGMAIFPDIKGVTSSILTSFRLLFTAMAVGLAGYFYNGTIYPIVGFSSGVILIVILTILWYERNKIEIKNNLLAT